MTPQELLATPASVFKPYNLDGQRLVAKVLKVHDTDTLTIGWEQHGELVKTNIRLAGIDAPELYSKKNGGKEAELCRLGRKWMNDMLLEKLIIVACGEYDKYGRLLADIYEFNEDVDVESYSELPHINQQLVDMRFARMFGGDLHKDAWTVEELDAGLNYGVATGMGLG